VRPDQSGKRECRGFTLFEFAVVVAIIGILMAVLLTRATGYQEQAEKAAMEQLLGTLDNALHYQIADLLMAGNMGAADRLVGRNPMEWLAEKPKNYAGEYYAPQTGVVAAGNWYFDLQNKNLVYLVDNREHLHVAPGESNKIRFQVKRVTNLSGNPGPAGSAANAKGNSVGGVILAPVVSYRWN
jgi:prepilin-type N-terminal cleavage/methylation domain-containing protein